MMQRSLVCAAILSVGVAIPAMAQNAAADAKKACENYNQLAATGDAATLVDEFYSRNAMFVGPAPVAGISIGHEAIQKAYESLFKASNAISATCDNVEVLSDNTVAINGHWTAVPRDATGVSPKGTYAMTFVKDGGKWLAAVDSWNMDLPPPPAKSQ
jgi:SnoaL-like protein